jgi:hypothetical protein
LLIILLRIQRVANTWCSCVINASHLTASAYIAFQTLLIVFYTIASVSVKQWR